ncbi:replication protein [Ectopseudomonas mendocina]|uniref:Replication protein n=1 Tax=Ectopseudomonas mendocina TaxID=300 RepID=A0A379IQS5_ECTME|nr:hypothetical protein [Pseudomonas mendocina]SUD38615.1 replication protein [Pseudomonas mendocina]
MMFGSFYTQWVRQDGLKSFRGGSSAGRSIAALKCFIALGISVHFMTRKVKLSLSGFEELTGLSKPMVIRGIEALEQEGVVSVVRGAHTNEYTLNHDYQEEHWAKLPVARLRKHLKEIPNRGLIPLTALKIYLVLATVRQRHSIEANIGYDKLREKTGVQRSQIRSALDILLNHSLIRVMQVEADTKTFNTYALLGLKERSVDDID